MSFFVYFFVAYLIIAIVKLTNKPGKKNFLESLLNDTPLLTLAILSCMESKSNKRGKK